MRKTLIGLAAVLTCGVGVAQAQPVERTTDQYTCKDIMRETGAGREVAVAFIHGYFLGKASATKFNLEVLGKQTDAFIERCLDNPNEKAMDAMAKVKG